MIDLIFTIANFLFSGTVTNPTAPGTCPGIAVAGGTIPFNPACFLSLPYTIWFPIFLLIIGISISVIVVIYMLSPLLGRNDIKLWSRVKIYELLLTVVLAVVFLTMSSLLYTIDPTSTLRSVGLLPVSCDPSVTTNTPSSYLIVDNMYSVALCDMYQFNVQVESFSTSIFYLAMAAGLAPTVDVNAVTLGGGPAALPNSGTQATTTPGIGFNLDFQIIPIQFALQYVVPLMGGYFAVVILSQVQQILLSASMILFSIFMIIGFTARAFSVTKTFGGSMIAFALGIGFVYPLVTLISYGFIDTTISNASTQLGSTSAIAGDLTQFVGGFVYAIVQILSSNCSNLTSASCQSVLFNGAGPGGSCPTVAGVNLGLACILTPFIVLGGFVAAGLMLLPLLNLVIVDAFIVDVSRVIGERMDLMSLLTRVV